MKITYEITLELPDDYRVQDLDQLLRFIKAGIRDRLPPSTARFRCRKSPWTCARLADFVLTPTRKFVLSSEFCLQATPEEVAAFKSLKHGEFGVYPCPRCGGIMEDVYEEGDAGICSSCFSKKRREERYKLLVEAERLFSLKPSASDAEIDLFGRIRKELEWGE